MKFLKKIKFRRILKKLAPDTEETNVVFREGNSRITREFQTRDEAIDFFLRRTKDQEPLLVPKYNYKDLVEVNKRYKKI